VCLLSFCLYRLTSPQIVFIQGVLKPKAPDLQAFYIPVMQTNQNRISTFQRVEGHLQYQDRALTHISHTSTGGKSLLPSRNSER